MRFCSPNRFRLLAAIACLPLALAFRGPLRADLITHLPLDSSLADEGPGGNDGAFSGGVEPLYVEGYDGTIGGAVSFDGVDDYIELAPTTGLPLTHNPSFSILMWVNGTVTPDDRIFSESSNASGTPLWTLGTHNTGADGTLDSFVRSSAGTISNHLHSVGTAFDNTWHHVAWVDDNGTVSVYIDGLLDAGTLNYARQAPELVLTTLGGVYRPNHTLVYCCFYLGAIDDVRLYDHPLTEEEVNAVLSGETCPPEASPDFADTHCDNITVTGPVANQPGAYTVTALDASDETLDEIKYIFTADDGAGNVVQEGPQTSNTAQLTLNAGTWTITVRVDDDLLCPDEAPDATCSRVVTVTCPAAGDTTCASATVTGPPGNVPGNYVVQAVGSADGNGDTILYTFTADNGSAPPVVVGPLAGIDSAFFTLGPGNWTLSVEVDDNLVCTDESAGNTCSTNVTVNAAPPILVSRWMLDGNLEDSQPSDNGGVFGPGGLPSFTTGFDGVPGGAILLDGVDDNVSANYNANLPIYANRAYSVALWVRGLPNQTDLRVFSESYSEAPFGTPAPPRNINPLFNIGTHNAGADGTVDIFIRGDGAAVPINHLHSVRPAFDDIWHHIAWVDDNGAARLYIDAVRDETDFTYTRIPLNIDTTSIGGIVRAQPSHWFQGEIDDVRVYNYALSPAEILALVPEPPGCPGDSDTTCDSLQVDAPPGNTPGIYQLSAPDADDLSLDAIIYTFTATHADGDYVQRGPGPSNVADIRIKKSGQWTFSVKVDDDLLCRDDSPQATCTRVITVTNPPQALVTHFRFDGNLDDFGAAGNDGVFSNLQEPVFVDDPDGNPGQAVTFDGVDDFVQAQIVEDLPIYSNPAVVAFTVALWVRGLPQTDRRVYSESSSIDTNPLFNLGTQAAGTTGQVDVFIRPGPGHRLSQGIAFDGEWHHLAWVDSCGDAALYIDGVQDPTDFTYVKPDMALDTTTVGGILRATACCWFLGDIDDVRVYNYALTPAEIMEIIEGQPPGRPEFHRGDTTGEGTLNITDGVAIFNWLFLGGPTPPCLESANANDSPAINITTGVYLLNFLFLGGPAPPPPGPPPAACAADPLASPTDLGCESYAGCGA